MRWYLVAANYRNQRASNSPADPCWIYVANGGEGLPEYVVRGSCTLCYERVSATYKNPVILSPEITESQAYRTHRTHIRQDSKEV